MRMNEIVTGRSIIVVNRASGNRTTGSEVASELLRRWPYGTIEQIGFQDLQSEPGQLEGAGIVFAAGGDGTICTVAGHCMDHSIPLFVPLDTGTEGIIPKVLGFGRKTGEKAIPYTQKILSAIENNTIGILNIPAGVVKGHKAADNDRTKTVQENFLLSAGTGVMATLIRSVEDKRYSPQTQPRIRSVIVSHYREHMPEAPVFSVQHGDNAYDCVDVNIFKSPFQRYFNRWSRITGEDRLFGLTPPEKGKSGKRILLDLALLSVGMRPKFGAIVYKRLAPGESIQIDQPPKAQYINSEDNRSSYDAMEIIPSDGDPDRVYHIAQRIQPSRILFTRK